MGLTQRELGELMGVSKISISFYEQGRREPREKIRIIIDFLLKNFDKLL
jgi:transcriptional regulator with XRE-family HTH domain